MEISEWTDAAPWDEAGDTWAVSPSFGVCWPVAAAGEDGMPDAAAGGAPCRAPLAWGAQDDPDYGNVQGWVRATDLGGLPGALLAAYWRGKVWLKLEPAGDGGAAGAGADAVMDEAMDGGGCVGECGEEGLPAGAAGRPVFPPLYICPQSAREGFLREEGGAWRADAAWEVLANFCYHPEEGVFEAAENGAIRFRNDRRVTIWLICADNVLCFYTTEGDRWLGDASELAPTAERMRYSAFGRTYADDEGSIWPEAEGGPFTPFWCAPLPWEGGAGALAAADGGDVCAAGPGGTAGVAGACGESGLPEGKPAAPAPPVYACPRFHASGLFGLGYGYALWPWEYGIAYGDTPTVEEYYGCGMLEAVERALTGEPEEAGSYETAQADYRFDPWAIEAQGVAMGFSVGYYTPGPDIWPAVATPYAILASATLEGPGYPLHLAIAGASTDSTLLTASMYAEESHLSDEGGGGGGMAPSVSDTEPGGGGGGGSWQPVPGDDEDDDDGDDDDGGWTYLPDGYYYEAGRGVDIAAETYRTRDAQGKVTHLSYGFYIGVDEAIRATERVQYAAQVLLSTTNGGSYTYKGRPCTMYYGFTAEEYAATAEVAWKSSYKYEDTDPKSAVCTLSLRGTVTAAADFTGRDAYATSEADLRGQSNILIVRKTGRCKDMRVAKGVRRRFWRMSVTLDRGTLKESMLYKALAQAPTAASVSPESIAGTGGNTQPTVTAAGAALALATPNAHAPQEVTGALKPAIRAQYGAASGKAAVTGGGSWHYDTEDGEAAASGRISGEFTITLEQQTKVLS